MTETYFINRSMIVPIEGFNPQEIHEGLGKLPPDFPLPPESINPSHNRYFKKLRDSTPDKFIDDTVSFSGGPPNVPTGSVLYEVPLEKGRVSVTMHLSDNLTERFSFHGFVGLDPDEEQVNELKKKLSGKSGITLSGEYHFGKESDNELSFKHYNNRALGFLINAFCQGERVKEEDILGGRSYRGPIEMNIPTGGHRVIACIKDFSLEKLREADKPLGEFFDWIKKEELYLATISELLSQAYKQNEAAEEFKKLRIENKITPLPETRAFDAVRSYFDSAREAASELLLTLPKNNRLDYLVSE